MVFRALNFYNIKKDMYSISVYGDVMNNHTGKILSRSISGNGYYTVGLQLNDNSRKIFYVHVLVATACIPNFLNKKLVNHKDLNKLNDYILNLEWVTHAENNEHARINHAVFQPKPPNKGQWGNGAATYGENNGMSRLKEAQAETICKGLEEGLSYGGCLVKAGMENTENNRFVVSGIARGIRWKHISKNYNLPPIKPMNDFSMHVIKICELIRDKYSTTQIAECFGDYSDSFRSFINRIKRKKTYADISNNYF